MKKEEKYRYDLVKSMHTVICAMDNENAYGRWIYTVPDQPSKEDFEFIAEDKESFEEVVNEFQSIMMKYAKDGFWIR